MDNNYCNSSDRIEILKRKPKVLIKNSEEILEEEIKTFDKNRNVKNQNINLKALKKKYETELSLRKGLQENIRVLDKDYISLRKKYEESEKKISIHNKDLENYSLKNDRFVEYYRNQYSKYKNEWIKVNDELKEAKEKYKCSELQRIYAIEVKKKICEEYKKQKIKLSEELNKEKFKFQTMEKFMEVLEKEKNELKEMIEKEKSYSEENKILQKRCEELEAINDVKNKKLIEYETKILNQNMYQKTIKEAEHYVRRYKSENMELKNKLIKVKNKLKEELRKGKSFELQRDHFKRENTKLAQELNDKKFKSSGNLKILNPEIIQISQELSQEKLKNRNLEIAKKVLAEEKSKLLVIIEQEKRINRILAKGMEENTLKNKCSELETVIEDLKAENEAQEKKLKNHKNLIEQNRRKLLATEVSRKEIKNFYENTLKNTRLMSERNLKEFLGELETTFLSFLNNHKRKAEITNKRRLDDIEQESERNCEIIDRKSRKISEKHKDNSVSCYDCDRSFNDASNCRKHITRTHKLTLISLFDVPNRPMGKKMNKN